MDMLIAMKEGARKPTQIMHASNLSWDALQDNIDALVSAGLVKEGLLGRRRNYQLTEEAVSVVEAYERTLRRVAINGRSA